MIRLRWTCIGTSLLAMAVGCAEAPLRGDTTPPSVSIALVEGGCDPETNFRCLCMGNVGDAAPHLREIGVDLDALQKNGWPCVPGDFDQDGAQDYAFPGEGYSCDRPVPVRVLFTRGGHLREVQTLPRKLSCLQRYVSNDASMPPGQGLVDWGEGNATWLYRFDSKGWLATSHLSEAH